MELVTIYHFNTTPNKEEWSKIIQSLNTLYPGIVWSSNERLQPYKKVRLLFVYRRSLGSTSRWELKYANYAIPQGQDVSWIYRNYNIPSQDGTILINTDYSDTEDLFGQLDESLIKSIIKQSLKG